MVIQIDLRDAGIYKGGIHIDGQVQIFQGYGEITAAVIIVKAMAIHFQYNRLTGTGNRSRITAIRIGRNPDITLSLNHHLVFWSQSSASMAVINPCSVPSKVTNSVVPK